MRLLLETSVVLVFKPWRDTMKKMAMIMATVAMLGVNSGFAQSQQTGKSASSSCQATCANGGMVWLIGLGSLAVLATLVGVTVSSSASTPSTFGH